MKSTLKVSQIPVKETITSSEISKGYTLGMKNVYPKDDVPVHELRRFPLTSYLSDIDLKTTGQLVTRMRNISAEVAEQQEKLETAVDKVRTITYAEISAANLQPLEDTIPFDEATTQLTSTFVSPEEFQTSINNVYTSLFTAVEEMMVQVFTTSMYARQYNAIYDDVSVDVTEYNKYKH